MFVVLGQERVAVLFCEEVEVYWPGAGVRFMITAYCLLQHGYGAISPALAFLAPGKIGCVWHGVRGQGSSMRSQVGVRLADGIVLCSSTNAVSVYLLPSFFGKHLMLA